MKISCSIKNISIQGLDLNHSVCIAVSICFSGPVSTTSWGKRACAKFQIDVLKTERLVRIGKSTLPFTTIIFINII